MKNPPKLRVGVWNILADGLSLGEFVTPNGVSDVLWENRREKISQILCSMALGQERGPLGQEPSPSPSVSLFGCQLIATLENDHPFWLLHKLQIQTNNPSWSSLSLFPSHPPSSSSTTPSLKPTQARLLRSPSPLMSFSSEHAPPFLTHLYSAPSLSSPFVCDMTMTLYYDSSKLRYLGSPSSFVLHSEEQEERGSMVLLTDHRPFFVSDFLHLESGSDVRIIVGHLSSGEQEEKERQRVKAMEEILKIAEEGMRKEAGNEMGKGVGGRVANTIVLMDSNNSEFYEAEYSPSTRTLSQVIKEGRGETNEGFKNVLRSKGNECLKIRHGQGGQKAKYGQLMFDAIDKIVVPGWMNAFQVGPGFSSPSSSSHALPLSSLSSPSPPNPPKEESYFGFQKYPRELSEILMKWRTTPSHRTTLRNFCLNVDNITNAPHTSQVWQPYQKSKRRQQIEEGKGFWMDSLKENRWGETASSIPLKRLSTALCFPPSLVQQILFSLYPNSSAPSDHPPCVVELELQKEKK